MGIQSETFNKLTKARLSTNPADSDYEYLMSECPEYSKGLQILGVAYNLGEIRVVFLLGKSEDGHKAVFKVSGEDYAKLLSENHIYLTTTECKVTIPSCSFSDVKEGYDYRMKNIALCSRKGDKCDILILLYSSGSVETENISKCKEVYNAEYSVLSYPDTVFMSGVATSKILDVFTDFKITVVSTVDAIGNENQVKAEKVFRTELEAFESMVARCNKDYGYNVWKVEEDEVYDTETNQMVRGKTFTREIEYDSITFVFNERGNLIV